MADGFRYQIVDAVAAVSGVCFCRFDNLREPDPSNGPFNQRHFT